MTILGMDTTQPRLLSPLGSIRLALYGFTKRYVDRYRRNGIRMNTILLGTMENAGAVAPATVSSGP